MTFWVEHPSISIPVYKSIWKVIDFIFPPTCVGCGVIGESICQNCLKQVKKINLPPTNSQLRTNTHFSDFSHFQSLDALYSFALYTPPISSAIKKLKYKRDVGISNLLAIFLIELYNKVKMDIDMIIPVPLNKKKIKDRGFNQSYFIALPFSFEIQKPVNKQSLCRTKDTRSQVGLNRDERFSNMSDAFTANPSQVRGKKILLIDDVTTTGATLEACAHALKSAGAKDIVALTVAQAVPTHYGFSDSEFDTNTA